MKFYLEQLINALHDSDIELLKAMDLKKSKIKNFLEVLIESRQETISREEEIKIRLTLDSNSYRKMKAVLLSKCIKALVPEGGIKLLEFLGRYGLSELFIREADKLIASMENSTKVSASEKAAIYKECYLGSTRLPYSLFDEDKLKNYEKGFLENYLNPDKVIVFNVLKLNGVFVRIIQTFYSMKVSEKNYQYFKNELSAIEQELKNINSERINVFIDGIYAVLDFYYQKMSPDIKNRLEKILDRYLALKGQQTDDEIFTIRFYLAYYETMTSNYAKSVELFSKLENDFDDLFKYAPKIIFRYTLALAINGEIGRMKEVADKYLKKYLQSYDPDAKVITCVAYLVYHLLKNELDKANEYVTIFQNSINRKALLSFDIAVRIFQVVLYYQRGDEKFSEQQFGKFLRYSQDRVDVSGIQRLVEMNKVLRSNFIQHLQKKISLSEFEENLTKLLKGNQAVLSVLFINAARLRAVES